MFTFESLHPLPHTIDKREKGGLQPDPEPDWTKITAIVTI